MVAKQGIFSEPPLCRPLVRGHHLPPGKQTYPHRPDGALLYYIAIYGVVTLPPQQPRVPSVPRDEGARGVGEELGPVVGHPT